MDLNKKLLGYQMQLSDGYPKNKDIDTSHVQQTTMTLPIKLTSKKLPFSTQNNFVAIATLNRMRYISISKYENTNWSQADSTIYATLTRDSKKKLSLGKLTLPLRTGSEPPVRRKASISAANSAVSSASSASAASSASSSTAPGAAMSPAGHLQDSQAQLAHLSGRLNFEDGLDLACQASDLRVDRELGQGVCGVVSMATHLPTGRRLAIKAMRLHLAVGADCSSGEERRRVLNDLEVAGKCRDCPHIVQFYGAVLCQSEVWVCMELMATCLDRLLRCCGNRGLSEPVLGKLVVPVLRALHYLKERHNLIHRDVKPSNVLLSWRGQVKLCDFGISGQLVNSRAHTRTAGCIAYLAPERITLSSAYDIRSDVWSLGVTLVELATGRHPLAGCSCEMELLTRIVDDPPPQLPRLAAGCTFSDHFRDFVTKCLMKDVNLRPKYQRLLCHDFVKYHEQTQTDLAEWLAELMSRYPELNVNSMAAARRRKLSAASSQGSSSGYGSADTNSPSSLQS